VALCGAALVGYFAFPTYPTYDSFYALLWGRDLLEGCCSRCGSPRVGPRAFCSLPAGIAVSQPKASITVESHPSAIQWRYALATMAVDTATIRVSRRTRDMLAGQARQRGVSLAALLAEIARDRELEAIWDSERQATLADAETPEAVAEQDLWQASLADGLG
jgi:hypothetical protein